MLTCQLTQSTTFIETLSIRPVESPANSFELLIRSRFLGAKDPSALQVKHRVIVTAEVLAGLRALIDQSLTLPAV